MRVAVQPTGHTIPTGVPLATLLQNMAERLDLGMTTGVMKWRPSLAVHQTDQTRTATAFSHFPGDTGQSRHLP